MDFSNFPTKRQMNLRAIVRNSKIMNDIKDYIYTTPGSTTLKWNGEKWEELYMGPLYVITAGHGLYIFVLNQKNLNNFEFKFDSITMKAVQEGHFVYLFYTGGRFCFSLNSPAEASGFVDALTDGNRTEVKSYLPSLNPQMDPTFITLFSKSSKTPVQ